MTVLSRAAAASPPCPPSAAACWHLGPAVGAAVCGEGVAQNLMLGAHSGGSPSQGLVQMGYGNGSEEGQGQGPAGWVGGWVLSERTGQSG